METIKENLPAIIFFSIGFIIVCICLWSLNDDKQKGKKPEGF